jgi:AcrR family transcriptional regulator
LAARGIDGVSLREINRASGQGNASAVQYHFGNRDGVVRAILDKHRRDTEPRRHALLDQYETAGAPSLRALSGALVVPMTAKLADPEGGRQYLQINCEYYTRPGFFEEVERKANSGSSIRRWHRLLDVMLAPEESVLHSRFPAMRFAFVELARRAMGPARRDDRLFTSHLVDMVTALFAVPISAETARLLAQRTGRATKLRM